MKVQTAEVSVEYYRRLVELAVEMRNQLFRQGVSPDSEETPVIGWTEEDMLLLLNKKAVELDLCKKEISNLQDEICELATRSQASTGQPMSCEDYRKARGWQ